MQVTRTSSLSRSAGVLLATLILALTLLFGPSHDQFANNGSGSSQGDPTAQLDSWSVNNGGGSSQGDPTAQLDSWFVNNGSGSSQGDPTAQLDNWFVNNGGGSSQGDPSGS